MKEHIKTIYSLLDNYDRKVVHGLLWDFFKVILTCKEYTSKRHKGGFANYVRSVPDVFTALYELRDLLENYELKGPPEHAEAGAKTINGRNKNECFHLNNIYFFYYYEDGKHEQFRREIEKWFPIWLKTKTSTDCRVYSFADRKIFRNTFFQITEAVFKLEPIITSGWFKDLEAHDIEFLDGNKNFYT